MDNGTLHGPDWARSKALNVPALLRYQPEKAVAELKELIAAGWLRATRTKVATARRDDGALVASALVAVELGGIMIGRVQVYDDHRDGGAGRVRYMTLGTESMYRQIAAHDPDAADDFASAVFRATDGAMGWGS